MPQRIYVAGPVVDYGDKPPPLYRELQQLASRYPDVELSLPDRRADIDHLEPREFASAIQQEIRRSDAVVAWVRRGDQSVPVETAMASFAGLPQLIVADEPNAVPRIVAGLAGVDTVVASDDRKRLSRAFDGLTEPRGEPMPS